MFRPASLAALFMTISSAAALAASQDINLTATVEGSCTISDSATPSAVNQALTVSPSGFVSAAPVNVTFPIVCNKAARLELSTINGGLTGPDAVPNYLNRINYTAIAVGAFPSVGLDTGINAPSLPDGGNPHQVTSNGPTNGDLSVTVTPTVGSAPLAPGNYADTLRLTITPVQ